MKTLFVDNDNFCRFTAGEAAVLRLMIVAVGGGQTPEFYGETMETAGGLGASVTHVCDISLRMARDLFGKQTLPPVAVGGGGVLQGCRDAVMHYRLFRLLELPDGGVVPRLMDEGEMLRGSCRGDVYAMGGTDFEDALGRNMLEDSGLYVLGEDWQSGVLECVRMGEPRMVYLYNKCAGGEACDIGLTVWDEESDEVVWNGSFSIGGGVSRLTVTPRGLGLTAGRSYGVRIDTATDGTLLQRRWLAGYDLHGQTVLAVADRYGLLRGMAMEEVSKEAVSEGDGIRRRGRFGYDVKGRYELVTLRTAMLRRDEAERLEWAGCCGGCWVLDRRWGVWREGALVPGSMTVWDEAEDMVRMEVQVRWAEE